MTRFLIIRLFSAIAGIAVPLGLAVACTFH